MTIEDRAREFMGRWKAYAGPPIMADDFMVWIIALMRNLVEDCAQVADRQAAGFQVLIDHAPTPIRAEDMKRVKHSAEITAKEIRALAGPMEETAEWETAEWGPEYKAAHAQIDGWSYRIVDADPGENSEFNLCLRDGWAPDLFSQGLVIMRKRYKAP